MNSQQLNGSKNWVYRLSVSLFCVCVAMAFYVVVYHRFVVVLMFVLGNGAAKVHTGKQRKHVRLD
jgi:uncharacterized membrane protein